MDKELIKNKISLGIRTAFKDRAIQSDSEYRPKFVFNDFRKGRKVLASLERELLHCDSFAISVAFITKSGLTPLLPVFKHLGIQGRGKAAKNTRRSTAGIKIAERAGYTVASFS